jgi:hypothetical protein
MKLYRDLSNEKIIEFQARKNYRAGSPIDGRWHPVVQRECVEINEDAYHELYREKVHTQGNKSDLL